MRSRSGLDADDRVGGLHSRFVCLRRVCAAVRRRLLLLLMSARLLQIGECSLRCLEIARIERLPQRLKRVLKLVLSVRTDLLSLLRLSDSLEILLNRRECALRTRHIARVQSLRERLEILAALFDGAGLSRLRALNRCVGYRNRIDCHRTSS